MTTRAQLRTMALRLADAENHPRWDNTAGGEVDLYLTVAADAEWATVLNVLPACRLSRVTVSAGTNGTVPLSSLTTGTGDALKRFYRILRFRAGNRTFGPATYRDWGEATQGSVGLTLPYVYWLEGDVVRALPLNSGESVEIAYNHLPQRIDSLATDSSVIETPSAAVAPRFEFCVALEAAAQMLEKGGTEVGSARALQSKAEIWRAEYVADLKRIASAPDLMLFADRREDWGA